MEASNFSFMVLVIIVNNLIKGTYSKFEERVRNASWLWSWIRNEGSKIVTLIVRKASAKT